MHSVQCSLCANKTASGIGCRAYPQGIPWDVLRGEHDHREPFPGDNGIRFEPLDTVTEETETPE